MGPFGFGEIIFLFFIALIIFGPKKLPELGKTLGKGLREFKKATDDLKSNWEDHLKDTESPVHELKQTFSEVQRDFQSAAHSIQNDVQAHMDDPQPHVEEPPKTEAKALIPEAPKTDEAKSDAHAN